MKLKKASMSEKNEKWHSLEEAKKELQLLKNFSN
jgi:hypothetical protein